MNLPLKLILTVALLLAVSNPAAAQKQDEYKECVRKLLVISKTEERVSVLAAQLFGIYRKQPGPVPAEFWDLAQEKFVSRSVDEMTELYTPIYKEYYTLKEIKKLIRFYESPLGRKTAENAPLITRRAAELGEDWGMRIFREIMDELGADPEGLVPTVIDN